MRFTTILAVIALTLLIMGCYLTVKFIGQRRGKKALVTAVCFLGAIAAMYYGFLTFITSM